MAISRITINHSVISSRFSVSPLGGTAVGGTRGFSRGKAESIAARIALTARINAASFHNRTGSLVGSIRPIVRPIGGSTEVGVGTTVEHGMWLERGTDPHVIPAPPFPAATLWDSGSKGEVPTEMKLRGSFKQVEHPGSKKNMHWLSNAVRTVLPGAVVTVRYPKGPPA